MDIFLSALNSQIRVTDRPMTRQGLGITTGAKGMTPVVVREVFLSEITMVEYTISIIRRTLYVSQNRPWSFCKSACTYTQTSFRSCPAI
jgi:hypothetical protein